MNVAVIIAAGGRGLRFGAAVPKQLLSVGGRTLLARSIDAFLTEPSVVEIVVVVPVDHLEAASAQVPGQASPRIRVVPGGARRQDSVARGLRAVSAGIDVVLVHDAARAFVTRDVIARTIEAAARDGAAIAAVPVHDTVKRARAGGGDVFVAGTLSREEIYLAQTPQGFRRSVLEAAVALGESGVEATDESRLAELAGFEVRIVAGDPGNIKVTTAADLEMAKEVTRIGFGYDSHRLVAGRPLVLGGVVVPFEKGLAGHSDADAVAHAVTDAVLGAGALGDIGQKFPDDDPRWQDADSLRLLAAAMDDLRAAGGRVVNVDVTVIAERPRLSPWVRDMATNLARVLGVEPRAVSVKAKTNEGQDAVGRGEAIVVHAVALVAY